MIEVPLPPDHPDAKLTPGLLRETLEQLTKSDPELKSRIEEQQQSLEHNFHLSLCLRGNLSLRSPHPEPRKRSSSLLLLETGYYENFAPFFLHFETTHT